MGEINLKNIFFTKLKKFTNSKGSVLHGIKKNDIGYKGFGEVYFSFVNYKKIKAWKCHQKMTCNLIVLLGSVKFIFSDGLNNFRKEIVTSKKNIRVTIPPKIWFGFQGMSKKNLIINISNIKHKNSEVLRKSQKEIKFNWSKI